MVDDIEPEFNQDVEIQQERIVRALDELSGIKAYTLKPDEIRDFKAAQYALRNLAGEGYQHDIEKEVYDE